MENLANTINRARDNNEIDLVYIVGLYLEQYIGKYAATAFLNDESIQACANDNSVYQRVFVNRYFTNLLFRYRYKKKVNMENVSVTNVEMTLTDDGDVDNWLEMFSKFVAPFLKDNKVFEYVY